MQNSSDLEQWLVQVSGPEWVWLAKRLSANDTGATGGDQVGIYVPLLVAFHIAPDLENAVWNPKKQFLLYLRSHDQESEPILTYYNNKILGLGTRNECRLTRLGGHGSALQDPVNAGAALLLAFNRNHSEDGQRQLAPEGWPVIGRRPQIHTVMRLLTFDAAFPAGFRPIGARFLGGKRPILTQY